MSGWIVWVIVACLVGVCEVLTKRFLLAPFVLGAVLAAIVDLAGAGNVAAWLAFVVVSLLALLAVRPIARSRVEARAATQRRRAALVGSRAIVLEDIANSEGVGCVTIRGEVWTARSVHEGGVIGRGARVRVVEIKGATALVAATDGAGSQ